MWSARAIKIRRVTSPIFAASRIDNAPYVELKSPLELRRLFDRDYQAVINPAAQQASSECDPVHLATQSYDRGAQTGKSNAGSCLQQRVALHAIDRAEK